MHNQDFEFLLVRLVFVAVKLINAGPELTTKNDPVTSIE